MQEKITWELTAAVKLVEKLTYMTEKATIAVKRVANLAGNASKKTPESPAAEKRLTVQGVGKVFERFSN